jgi:hypothetical protein
MKFLDYITTLPDVWIVPISAGIEYRKNPKTNDELLVSTRINKCNKHKNGDPLHQTLYSPRTPQKNLPKTPMASLWTSNDYLSMAEYLIKSFC